MKMHVINVENNITYYSAWCTAKIELNCLSEASQLIFMKKKKP